MIYKIVGKGKDYKELEIGENNNEIGITIIDKENEVEHYVQISRDDWEDIIKSMDYMKKIRATEDNE
jgi:hypothetical protein